MRHQMASPWPDALKASLGAYTIQMTRVTAANPNNRVELRLPAGEALLGKGFTFLEESNERALINKSRTVQVMNYTRYMLKLGQP